MGTTLLAWVTDTLWGRMSEPQQSEGIWNLRGWLAPKLALLLRKVNAKLLGDVNLWLWGADQLANPKLSPRKLQFMTQQSWLLPESTLLALVSKSLEPTQHHYIWTCLQNHTRRTFLSISYFGRNKYKGHSFEKLEVNDSHLSMEKCDFHFLHILCTIKHSMYCKIISVMLTIKINIWPYLKVEKILNSHDIF